MRLAITVVVGFRALPSPQPSPPPPSGNNAVSQHPAAVPTPTPSEHAQYVAPSINASRVELCHVACGCLWASLSDTRSHSHASYTPALLTAEVPTMPHRRFAFANTSSALSWLSYRLDAHAPWDILLVHQDQHDAHAEEQWFCE